MYNNPGPKTDLHHSVVWPYFQDLEDPGAAIVIGARDDLRLGVGKRWELVAQCPRDRFGILALVGIGRPALGKRDSKAFVSGPLVLAGLFLEFSRDRS